MRPKRRSDSGEKTDLKKKICNTDRCMYAYVNSKEEVTVLYREVRD